VRASLAASVAAGVDRRAGAALRLLPERNDDPGRRSAGDDQAADRGADPHRDERASVPLRHVSADPDGHPEGCGRDGEGWEVTMTEMLNKEFSRKSFVKAGGALIVGLASGGALASAGTAAMPTSGGYNPDLTQVDSFLTLKSDNTWEIVFGQPEWGHGATTGIAMLVAEELDVGMDQVAYPTPDTWRNGNGGGGGSGGIISRALPVRAAAVAARGALLGMAATQLGVAASTLTVSKDVVSGGGKSVNYSDLLGGKLFKL